MSTETAAIGLGFPADIALLDDIREHLAVVGDGLVWIKKTGRKVVPGRRVATSRTHKYDSVRFRGKRLYVHRIVFALTTGAWPAHDVDHIDGNKKNNHPDNLRPATRSQNCGYKADSGRNTSGRMGVGWARHAQAWYAKIVVRGVTHHLGYFKAFDEACQTRERAETDLLGEYKWQR
jgi:hypothetical protein